MYTISRQCRIVNKSKNYQEKRRKDGILTNCTFVMFCLIVFSCIFCTGVGRGYPPSFIHLIHKIIKKLIISTRGGKQKFYLIKYPFLTFFPLISHVEEDVETFCHLDNVIRVVCPRLHHMLQRCLARVKYLLIR